MYMLIVIIAYTFVSDFFLNFFYVGLSLWFFNIGDVSQLEASNFTI